MTTLRSLTVLALAASLVSCTYPNEFQGVPDSTPHAVLVGEGVRFFSINEQPMVSWRMSQQVRIPVGPTAVQVVAGRVETHGYPVLRFNAEAGQTYRVQRLYMAYFDHVTVRDAAQNVVAEVDREQIR